MIDQLHLLTGIDIPFQEANLIIHQPTIEEISFIEESNFFAGCTLLTITKDQLKTEGKIDLSSFTNFDIFMSMIEDKDNLNSRKMRIQVQMLLSLMFPDYKIIFKQKVILFLKEGEKELHTINTENFDTFAEIINEIFCLKKGNKEEYNPQNDRAKAIADKLKKGRELAAMAKGQKVSKNTSIISRYMSILAVGLKVDINVFKKYTVYQLFDQMDRFELKMSNDIYLEAKMAGATDLQEVDNWMKDIHS